MNLEELKNKASKIKLMAFDVDGYEKTYLSNTTVNADNVTLEGIYFTDGVILYPINNFHIKRCHIVNSLT